MRYYVCAYIASSDLTGSIKKHSYWDLRIRARTPLDAKLVRARPAIFCPRVTAARGAPASPPGAVRRRPGPAPRRAVSLYALRRVAQPKPCRCVVVSSYQEREGSLQHCRVASSDKTLSLDVASRTSRCALRLYQRRPFFSARTTSLYSPCPCPSFAEHLVPVASPPERQSE
jgi:hypothetical protein